MPDDMIDQLLADDDTLRTRTSFVHCVDPDFDEDADDLIHHFQHMKDEEHARYC